MGGVTNKFLAGGAITSAEVNANFADLKTLAETVPASSVLDGTIYGTHINAASPLRVSASMATPAATTFTDSGLSKLVGSNGIFLPPAGSTDLPFTDIEDKDVVIVSASAWFTFSNPFGSPTNDNPMVGTLSLKHGAPGTEADIPGAGADVCSRGYMGLHNGGRAFPGPPITYGYGVAATAYQADTSDIKWMFSLDWVFQCDIAAVPHQRNITLFVDGMPATTLCTGAELLIYVIKR